MKRFQSWAGIATLAVVVALPSPVHPAEAQGSMVQYVWNAGSEGFAAYQNAWGQVSGGWGGDYAIPTHSARMVSITGLSDAGAQANLTALVEGLQVPLTNLAVTLDAFKDSSAGWHPATGGTFPAFNDAFDNSYSSLVMVWLADGGVQYSFGAELDAANGIQAGLTLQYLGSRVQVPLFSNLEVYLQTYQGAGDAPFTYRIDNLTIAAAPEPASVGLLGVGCAAVMLQRRRR